MIRRLEDYDNMSLEDSIAYNAEAERIAREQWRGTLICGESEIGMKNRHTGRVITITWHCDKWRSPSHCPICLSLRIDRIIRQIEEEQRHEKKLYWHKFGRAGAEGISKRLREMSSKENKPVRWASFPVKGGGVYFIFNHAAYQYRGMGGAKPLSADKNELRTLAGLMADTPLGRRRGGIRANKDKGIEAWGRKWAGCRNPSKSQWESYHVTSRQNMRSLLRKEGYTSEYRTHYEGKEITHWRRGEAVRLANDYLNQYSKHVPHNNAL